MAEPLKKADSKSTSTEKPPAEGRKKATPLSCFSGAAMSGTLSILCYRMMVAIATTFAAKPVVSDNTVVVNISVAVRTLVTGIVALGAGVFGITAVGLLLLGLQLLLKKLGERDATA